MSEHFDPTEWAARRAVEVARRSKHPRTQVGAVLISRDGRIAEGCNDDDLHAEVACIADAALRGIPTLGATMVCTWAACPACAKAIVAAGVSVVYSGIQVWESPERWRQKVEDGIQHLKEHKVEVRRAYARACPASFRFDGLTMTHL